MTALTCRTCGTRLRYFVNGYLEADTMNRHVCKPKVKIYTDEEKRRLQESREPKIRTEENNQKA
jgi:hypothetical protein